MKLVTEEKTFHNNQVIQLHNWRVLKSPVFNIWFDLWLDRLVKPNLLAVNRYIQVYNCNTMKVIWFFHPGMVLISKNLEFFQSCSLAATLQHNILRAFHNYGDCLCFKKINQQTAGWAKNPGNCNWTLVHWQAREREGEWKTRQSKTYRLDFDVSSSKSPNITDVTFKAGPQLHEPCLRFVKKTRDVKDTTKKVLFNRKLWCFAERSFKYITGNLLWLVIVATRAWICWFKKWEASMGGELERNELTALLQPTNHQRFRATLPLPGTVHQSVSSNH